MEHLIPSFIHVMLNNNNNKNERWNVWELIVEEVIAVTNEIHYHIFLTNNLVNCNHIELNIKELKWERERRKEMERKAEPGQHVWRQIYFSE